MRRDVAGRCRVGRCGGGLCRTGRCGGGGGSLHDEQRDGSYFGQMHMSSMSTPRQVLVVEGS
jgi:hypothetical protein